MARNGIGIDIGTDSIRLVSGVDRKGVFSVRQFVTMSVGGRAGDPRQVAAALQRALAAAGVKGDVFCGLTGRDVVIRYSQVPLVPDWQLRQLMEFEIQEMTGQSGDQLAADFNLLPVSSDLSSDDTVLLALAKQGILDAHLSLLSGAGLKARAFSPNSIALYNAYRKTSSCTGTVLLANVGARNTDLAIAREGDLLFARNVSGGGELFDDALIASFNVSAEKARRLKEELADVSPFDSATRRSAQEEKVARALSGATGQLFSMVQSSVMFARSQTGINDLALDRVLLSGGGSLLTGLDRYLASNLNVPVERFDPFDSVDLSAVEDELDDTDRSGAVVALGLTLSASYDDVYSIEIVPPSVKKARAFKERTLFSILAVLLAVLFLVHDAISSKQDHAVAASDLVRVQREQSNRQKRATAYEEGVAERIVQARKLELLESRLTAGTGLDRALGMVQRYLPEDLYVTSVALRMITDPDLTSGKEQKPVIEVKGEGREGAQSLEQLFNRFAQELARDPLLARTPRTQISPASDRKPFEWTVTMNFSIPQEKAQAEPEG
ncbi:MAG: pilus assembly protein PilM [Planctomycetota bacterium]